MTFFCSLLVAVVSGWTHCRRPIKDCRSIVQIQEKCFQHLLYLWLKNITLVISAIQQTNGKHLRSTNWQDLLPKTWLTKGCPTKFWYERNILQHIFWLHGSFLKCSILNNTLRHNGEVGQHLIKIKPRMSGTVQQLHHWSNCRPWNYCRNEQAS